MVGQLSAKYHFGAMDTTGGKVMNRAILSNESENIHRLYLPVLMAMQTNSWSLVATIKT